MLHVGLYTDKQKEAIIKQYCQDNDLSHVVVISPEKHTFLFDGADQVEYSDTIEYATFYRLLEQINNRTLVVVSECLRTQNRYDLTYNCIRNFLNQTTHQIIFNTFPIIDTIEDFMILFDFDTQSRWNAKEREQVRNERVNVAISREMYVKPQRKVSAKGIGKARHDGQDQHGDVVVWSKAKIAEVYGV